MPLASGLPASVVAVTGVAMRRVVAVSALADKPLVPNE
jgi:hypothetical protein